MEQVMGKLEDNGFIKQQTAEFTALKRQVNALKKSFNI
jgi:hypothetical protein